MPSVTTAPRTAWGVHDFDGVTAAPSGCGWYRIIMPLLELGKQDGWSTGWRDGVPPAGRKFDIIHGQRLDKPEGLPAWRRLTARSRLLYDIDDDLWNIRPSNWVAYQTFRAVSRDTVSAYARYADMVTVSTEPLADIMRRHNPNVRVLPNHVPGWLLDHDRPRRDRVVVGWAGGSSHAEDIQMVAGQVRRAMTDAGDAAELHLIGANFLRTIGPVPHSRYTDWIPVNEGGAYYKAIDFDVALAPLLGSVFDESKSALKALESMALGIPVIASACTPYRGIVIDGVTGYLIDKKRRSDWGKRLRELICDEDARREMGAKAREVARAHVIDNGWRLWAAAYEELM